MGNLESTRNSGDGSSITVSFDRERQFYLASETVQGTVRFQNRSDRRVRVFEVYLTITGEIGYTTQEQRTVKVKVDNGDGSGQTTEQEKIETYTKNHRKPFYWYKVSVAWPSNGVVGLKMHREKSENKINPFNGNDTLRII